MEAGARASIAENFPTAPTFPKDDRALREGAAGIAGDR
jgi:hypothetical protein